MSRVPVEAGRGDHPAVRAGAAEGAGDRRIVALTRRTARRAGAAQLRRTRGAAGRGAQDRLGRHDAGVRRAGVSGRHPHPPARPALAAERRPERRADRARPEAAVSARALAPASSAHDLLTAASIARPAAATARSARSAAPFFPAACRIPRPPGGGKKQTRPFFIGGIWEPYLKQFQKKCGRERERVVPGSRERERVVPGGREHEPLDGFDGLTASKLGAGEWRSFPLAHARSYVRVSGHSST